MHVPLNALSAIATLFLTKAIPLAWAGQVPVVDGVLGGVGNTTSSTDGTYNRISRDPIIGAVRQTGQLRIVENSGICETTPGVYQASGYGDISSDKSIWFWYFDARNNPHQAPLILWFNGGPGASSMIGLFQENGPCRIKMDSSGVENNPNSWNTNANVLYIDQPVGVGFSYGTLDVDTTSKAAADVWSFLQIFLADARFAWLKDCPLGLWTESYGGHYGPDFASYFLDMNTAIAANTINGIPLNLKVLGIGDGLTNPLAQYPGYLAYAASNPYHPLVSSLVIQAATNAWSETGGCMDRITNCYNTGSTATCSDAQQFCNADILNPLAGVWDVYYVPTQNPDPYPPDFSAYLASVSTTIGAETSFMEINYNVYYQFAATGDWMHNSAPFLEKVINAGIRTHIYDGDADYILNFIGVEAMVDALQTQFSASYAQQAFAPYTVKGQVAGQYKNAGGFSYLRVFGAGHEVPAYTTGTLGVGEAALQMFSQVMGLGPLVST